MVGFFYEYFIDERDKNRNKNETSNRQRQRESIELGARSLPTDSFLVQTLRYRKTASERRENDANEGLPLRMGLSIGMLALVPSLGTRQQLELSGGDLDALAKLR